MSKKILIVILLIFLYSRAYSLDINLCGGFSSLTYAEVGPNNKDDLYDINCILAGFDLVQPIKDIDLKLSVKAQIPYSLGFTDALGSDDYNYLNYLFYYGANIKLGIQKSFNLNDFIFISPGLFLNYDYIYLEDYVVGMNDTYLFSILGSGIQIESKFKLANRLNAIINFDGALNFIPISDRDGELKWSYNILLSVGVGYEI